MIPIVTFLGTSASMPTRERNTSSLVIHYDKPLAFDFGEGTQRQMQKFNVHYGRIKDVFITHAHLDHFLGLLGFLETLKQLNVQGKVKVYAPKKVARYLFDHQELIEFFPLKEGVIMEEKFYRIHAIKVKHTKESFAFLFEEKKKLRFDKEKCKRFGLKGRDFKEILRKGEIEKNGKKIKIEDVTYIKEGKKILYTGDISLADNIDEKISNIDVLIHEATFSENEREKALEKFHSTAKKAGERAKRMKAKLLILTHFSPRYKNTKILVEEAKKEFENVIAAKDGMKIEVRDEIKIIEPEE